MARLVHLAKVHGGGEMGAAVAKEVAKEVGALATRAERVMDGDLHQ
jgi:hypothetical protein